MVKNQNYSNNLIVRIKRNQQKIVEDVIKHGYNIVNLYDDCYIINGFSFYQDNQVPFTYFYNLCQISYIEYIDCDDDLFDENIKY